MHRCYSWISLLIQDEKIARKELRKKKDEGERGEDFRKYYLRNRCLRLNND